MDIDWQSCYVWIWWRCQAVKVCDFFVSYGMLQFSSKLLFLWKCHTLQKEMTCSQNITITFIIDNWNETVNHYVFVSCLGTAFWTHWKTFFRMWTSTFPCKPQTCSLVDASTGWFFFLNLRYLTVKKLWPTDFWWNKLAKFSS